MSEPVKGSNADETRPEWGPTPWWESIDLRRARVRSQIDFVVASLRAQGVLAEPHFRDPQDPASLEFMYRQGVILVRDTDVERVRQVLADSGNLPTDEGQADSQEADRPSEAGLIGGIAAIRVPDTLRALMVVDERLGLGIATPDHIFHVTPGGVLCPATEPIEPGQVKPYPPVSHNTDCDGHGVLAMVVDTGWIPYLDNLAHPWLAGVRGDPEMYDPAHITRYVGHGSFVAGVLRCMAPQTEVDVKGLLTHGGAVTESKIIADLYRALEDSPDIISMSAGATTRFGLPSLGFEVLWEQRLQYMKGTVIVCAAGNDGNRGPFWPAAFPWAVSVGALDETGRRAGYSNFGSWVDVYALGSDVINAFPNGTYIYEEPPQSGSATFTHEMAMWSGTSFATPLVSGLIAARMSRTGESGRDAADALLELAVAHARRGVGPVLEPGWGCVDGKPPCGCAPNCACGCGC